MFQPSVSTMLSIFIMLYVCFRPCQYQTLSQSQILCQSNSFNVCPTVFILVTQLHVSLTVFKLVKQFFCQSQFTFSPRDFMFLPTFSVITMFCQSFNFLIVQQIQVPNFKDHILPVLSQPVLPNTQPYLLYYLNQAFEIV